MPGTGDSNWHILDGERERKYLPNKNDAQNTIRRNLVRFTFNIVVKVRSL